MTRIVVDASAIVEYLLQTDRGQSIGVHLRPAELVAVPEVCDLEVVAALRSGMLRGTLALSRAQHALNRYVAMPLERFRHIGLLPRVFDLRDQVTPYDAAYLALATALGAGLLTADRRLTSTARSVGIEVVRAAAGSPG